MKISEFFRAATDAVLVLDVHPNGRSLANGRSGTKANRGVFDAILAKLCFCSVYSPPGGIYT